jgi:hypothetical protein
MAYVVVDRPTRTTHGWLDPRPALITYFKVLKSLEGFQLTEVTARSRPLTVDFKDSTHAALAETM